MHSLPQRQVTMVVTLIADSDDRVKTIIEDMVMTDGAALDYQIVDIREVPAPESPQ
jgi:hypothetical protein